MVPLVRQLLQTLGLLSLSNELDEGVTDDMLLVMLHFTDSRGPVSQVVNKTVLHHGMLWVRFPPTTGLGMKALPSQTIKYRNLVGAAVVRKI